MEVNIACMNERYKEKDNSLKLNKNRLAKLDLKITLGSRL